MDGGADIEMPSPKRIRLEVSKSDLPDGESTQAECLDVLHEPHSVPSQFPSTGLRGFHLPGLKLHNDEPHISKGYPKPDLKDDAVDILETTLTVGEECCSTKETAPDAELELERPQDILSEHRDDAPSGDSALANPAPKLDTPQEIGLPLEILATESMIPEPQALERVSEPQLDETLHETTNLPSESLAGTIVQDDAPSSCEVQSAGAGSLDTKAEARNKEIQEATDTSNGDDSKQETEARNEELQEKSVGGPTHEGEHVVEASIGTNHESTVAEEADVGKHVIGLELHVGDQLLGVTEPPHSSFKEVAEANKFNAEAEFEVDSSPYASSSSDTSTDCSSSDDSEDEDDAEDYEMLSPEEEARRLMAEDGGGDEKAIAGVPRTQNEKPDDVVLEPQVSITADMVIEELGDVESLVENSVLIKANISGEYQVLESGSLLCLADRTVLGVVAETLGRVQQPYYSVRFPNHDAIRGAGIKPHMKVFYVKQHSTTVFTQPLKAYKGSDASNLHDEEVGDDELEFSDDEAEAEHKRQVKLLKRARYDAKHGHENGVSGVAQPRPGAPNHPNGRSNTRPEHFTGQAETSLDYDDAGGDSDDTYTPLARPTDLHEMMARESGPGETHHGRGDAKRGGRGRGRGDRGGGRGRGSRGRGNDRGGRPDQRAQNSFRGNGQPHAHPNRNQESPTASQSNGSMPPPNSGPPPRPYQQSNGPHSHSQSQHLPTPSPAYPANPSPQPHAHPSFVPQYPQIYNQPYPQQHQQSQYQYQDPYFTGFPQQGFSPGLAYSGQQIPPTPPSAAAIPPGAHINPNFFRQQAQSSPQSWYPQQGQVSPSPQQYQQYQQPSPVYSNAGGISPEAARRLQENLNRLKGIGSNGSSGK